MKRTVKVLLLIIIWWSGIFLNACKKPFEHYIWLARRAIFPAFGLFKRKKNNVHNNKEFFFYCFRIRTFNVIQWCVLCGVSWKPLNHTMTNRFRDFRTGLLIYTENTKRNKRRGKKKRFVLEFCHSVLVASLHLIKFHFKIKHAVLRSIIKPMSICPQ